MGQKIYVTGSGDSLFTAAFPKEYDAGIKAVSDYIQSCDIKLTNLETNLSDGNLFAGAYSGGTWLNTRTSYLPELMRFGFNVYGTANNHVMDYSYGGLLSTLNALNDKNLAHAGSGRSLEEAAAPAVLAVKGKKIAVFAVDSSQHDASRAGRGSKSFPPRPGVNFLRHSTTYKISKEEEQQLRDIAGNTKINFLHQLYINTGFASPDPDGCFSFGPIMFTTKDGVPDTQCDPEDKERLVNAVRQAAQEYDLVFMLVHCHDDDSVSHDNPPQYLTEFFHACIDAGAAGIFGGGCHSLRGLEIYRGCPIFYSLGDFIYQGLQVEFLPPDFMEKFHLDVNATAAEGLMARSRGGKVGLHLQKENYQSILPRIEYTDGKMTGLTMVPLYLNFDRKDAMNGLPVLARGKDAEEIFEIFRKLSAAFGTDIHFRTDENGNAEMTVSVSPLS